MYKLTITNDISRRLEADFCSIGHLIALKYRVAVCMTNLKRDSRAFSVFARSICRQKGTTFSVYQRARAELLPVPGSILSRNSYSRTKSGLDSASRTHARVTHEIATSKIMRYPPAHVQNDAKPPQ